MAYRCVIDVDLREQHHVPRRSATGGNARVARELLTGVVPVIISSAWDTFVLPLFFYLLAQSERQCVSLHALDKRVSSFFFYFATFNTFFGAALGGCAFLGMKASRSLQVNWKLLPCKGVYRPATSFGNTNTEGESHSSRL